MIQIDKPMPDGCDVCPLMYDYIQCNALPEGCKDDDAFNEEFDWTKRPKWCPLKEQEAVVRCKDCKNAEVLEWLDNAIICKKHSYTGVRPDEFYCADGERREDDA